MNRRTRTFDGCPFCGGRLPTVNRDARGRPKVYKPHPGVRCLCGFAEMTEVRECLAANLALARASASARLQAQKLAD